MTAGDAWARNKKGWTAGGKLTTGQPDSNVAVACSFAPEAGYYTVQFNVIVPKGTPFQATASIQWTVEGGTIYRKVSVGNGVSVSGTGQAVKVVVNDQTSPTAPKAGTQYAIQITVSPGTRPNVEQPPTLIAKTSPNSVTSPNVQGTVLIAPGGAVLWDVPQDAGVISAMISSVTLTGAGAIAPDNTLVNMTDAVPNLWQHYKTTDKQGFVDVGPNVTQIQVSNLDAANTAGVTIVWGIDG